MVSNCAKHHTIFQQTCFWLVPEKNSCTGPFLDAKQLPSQRTWKAKVCVFLSITVGKSLFQRRKNLSSGGGEGGE